MHDYQARYQSANLSDTESRDCFVVRQREFKRVMDSICDAGPKDSIQHYVFIGRRGSGKSTLLRRIQAEVGLSDLSEQHLVVNLSEEQAGIYQLYDLWDYVLRDFEQQGLSPEFIDWQDFEDDMQDYTQALFVAVSRCLDKAGKRLILLIDNIERIFKNIGKGSGGGADLFREQLMNGNAVRIIGASTEMSEDFWRYDMPFYDFFKIERLESLSIEEIKELLNHWADQKQNDDIRNLIKQQPGKLQAIRMLTDGTPRTMLLFIDMLVHRPEQNGYAYLRKIIDEATPIYQERLDKLSAQQQKVLVELSFFWEAAPVERLIPKCKMPGKTISAQLNALVDKHIVEKVKGGTKNHSYRLEERFFNLWLLMTQGGPKQKREVKYLTVFLENWYDAHEIKELYSEFVEGMDAGRFKPDYMASMTKALVHTKSISIEERDALIDRIKKLRIGEEWTTDLPPKVEQIHESVGQYISSGNYDDAILLLTSIEQEDSDIYFSIGLVKHYKGDLSGAVESFRKSISLRNSSVAWDSLGRVLIDQDRIEEAKSAYEMAIDLGYHQSLLSISKIYIESNEFDIAESYLLKAIELNVDKSVLMLCQEYVENDEWGKAQKLLEPRVESGKDEYSHWLGYIYDHQDNLSQAKKLYKAAINTGDYLAHYNLANLYQLEGKTDLALKNFRSAFENEVEIAKERYVLLSYDANQIGKKSDSVKLIRDVQERDLELFGILGKSVIYLWAGEMELFQELIDSELNIMKNGISAESSRVLNEWLVHGQYRTVLELFEHEDLKEKMQGQMRPLYYATLKLLDKQEQLKNMPPELEENVNDILEYVKERQEFYYGEKDGGERS